MNFFDHSLHQDPVNREEPNGHLPNFPWTFAENDREWLPTERLAGSDLAPWDFAALEARWIDRDVALAARLRRVDSPTGAELVGRKRGNYAGIAIPYFLPGSRAVRKYRLRRDHPEMEIDSRGQVKPKQKYLSPPGRGNLLYFAPGVTDAQLQDPALPLIITEGLALWRLANWNVECPRFLPVGVSGVYNWRGSVGKTTGSTARGWM